MNKKFTDKTKIKEINRNELFVGEYFIDITSDVVEGIYDYYMVSNFGRVYHKYFGKIMSPGINKAGYYYFIASTENGPKPIQIHRIMMILFKPINNFCELDVNHKNGKKLDLNINNLEWLTHSENIIHAYDTGLHPRGQDNPRTVLTDEIVTQICILLQENQMTNKQIADLLGNGVTETIVSSIKKRLTWKHISEPFTFCQRKGRALSEEMVHNICLYFSSNPINNLSIMEYCRNALISLHYDISLVDSVRKIYVRKYYTNISKHYNF